MKVINNEFLEIEGKEAKYDVLGDYDILDAVERSLKNESLTVQAGQRAYIAMTDKYKEDPNYLQETKDLAIKNVSHKIHPDFLHNLDGVRSQEEMNDTIAYLEEETLKQQKLESLGFGGVLINLGSNLVDVPLILGATAATTVAAPSIFAVGAATLGRRALLGGATEVLFEGAKDLIGEKDRTAIDYTLGAVFGAGVAATFKNKEALAAASKRIIKDTLKMDDLASKLKNAKTQEEKDLINKNHFDSLNLDQNLSYKQSIANINDKSMSKFNKNPIYDSLRVDLAYRTANSKSQSLKSFADQMYIDATGQANPSNIQTGAELSSMIENKIIDSYHKDFYKATLDYGELGFGSGFIKTRFNDVSTILSNIAGQAQMRRNLYSEDTVNNIEFIKNELMKNSSNKSINDEFAASMEDLAKRINKNNTNVFTSAHDTLVRYNKKDFADGSIPKTDTYMPIVYNRNMADIIESKGLGYNQFNTFIKGAVESYIVKHGSLNEAQQSLLRNSAEFVAGQIWKNKHSDTMVSKSYDDLFADFMKNQEGIKEEFIDAIFDPKKAFKDDKELAASLNYRTKMDYGHKQTFINANGKETEISFMDLVETDMTNVIAQYSRKMGGTTALDNTKFTTLGTEKDKPFEYTLDSFANIEKARKQIHEELIKSGAGKREIEADLVRFDETVKELQGLPTAVDPFSEITQLQRTMKNLNIARLLGQTGWTMSAELGSVAFEAGIKNFMEFSSFKAMFRQFRTGEIDDSLAQEIQTSTSLGTMLTRAIGVNKYDHQFSFNNLGSSTGRESFLNAAEGFSEKATEATLLFGGVKPLTSAFEMTMAKSILHEVLEIGKRGAISVADAKFLNEIGIDDAMSKRIYQQLDKHGKFEARKWSNGHKVTQMNFDNWDDLEAQDMLIMALRRKTNQVVQQSGLGDKIGIVSGKNLFKNTIAGRFFLELKDYMITSYVKQFGRGMERRDAYVAGLWATQLGLLSMATAMQNVTNFAGNKEKLDESFELNNFARTVVGRMPATAYLPTIVDNAARLATGDTVFNSNRYHSGVQDAFMSMPSVDLAQKAAGILSLPYNATFGGGIKGKDVGNVFGVAPLGNAYGVRTVQEYLKAIADEK